MADLSVLMPIFIAVGAVFIFVMGFAALVKKFYIKVDQGTALIINTLRSKTKVTFTGGMVLPIIHRMDIRSGSVSVT